MCGLSNERTSSADIQLVFRGRLPIGNLTVGQLSINNVVCQHSNVLFNCTESSFSLKFTSAKLFAHIIHINYEGWKEERSKSAAGSAADSRIDNKNTKRVFSVSMVAVVFCRGACHNHAVIDDQKFQLFLQYLFILSEQKQYAGKLQTLSKILFDSAQPTKDGQSNYTPLELYIEDMDAEQIWQQLEAQNDSLWDDCMTESCRLLSLNEDKYKLKIKYPGEESEASEDEDDEDDEDEDGLNGNDEDDIEEEEDEELDYSDEDLEGEEEEEEENDSDQERRKKKKSKVPMKPIKIVPSIVDDQFFKLSEMEAFLEGEDKKEMDRMNGKAPKQDDYDSDDEEQEIDYFDSLSTDSESDDDEDEDEDDEAEEKVKDKEKHMKFADFFDEDDQDDEEEEEEESPEARKQRFRAELVEKNKRKKSEMKEDLGLDDSENESADEENEDEQNGEDEQSDEDHEDDKVDDGNEGKRNAAYEEIEKSEFALRQDRLQCRIEELEENAMGDKSWQLKGEITSSTRPKNSLLEEVLEFDSVARPPPQITEQTTECLEDIIKRRIKSKAWDDVERKHKPAHDQQDFRKNLVLNQEKSKESLAQIYEKEFLEKVHKLNNVDDDSKPDEPPEHAEIRKAAKDLFIKLDALSNFHFTAKPVAAEPKIITNLPAIEMEEVAPVSVSDATLLAPEEVRARPIGDEIGKSERTDADKKRERRKKKLHQKLTKQRDDKRVEEKEKLGIKVTTKEKQKQLMNQVTKSRNVIKVSVVVIDSESIIHKTTNRTATECTHSFL